MSETSSIDTNRLFLAAIELFKEAVTEGRVMHIEVWVDGAKHFVIYHRPSKVSRP